MFTITSQQEKYLMVAAVVLSVLLVMMLSKKFVYFITRRLAVEDQIKRVLSKLLSFIAITVGTIYLLTSFGVRIGPLLGTIGIGGVALAFALQNLVMNLLGSVLIHARRPFRVGDQIIFKEHHGTVVDINTRTVVLMAFDGTFIHVPNAKVMEEPFTNLTKETNRRSHLNVQVAYGTDLELALQIASEAVRSNPDIANEMLTEAIVTGFRDSGISIQVRFWHPSEQLVTHRVISDVAVLLYNAFAENNIEIPLPHVVVQSRD